MAFNNAKNYVKGIGNKIHKSMPERVTIIENQKTDDNVTIAHELQKRNLAIDKVGNKRRKISHYLSDLIIVLDMDECLISAPRSYEDAIAETKVDVMHVTGIFPFPVRILLRPHLIHFLKTITSRYETHIFTAAGKETADKILDELCKTINNPQAFHGRWYSNDCTTVDVMDLGLWEVTVKPLEKIVGCSDLRRIVHVDDRSDSFLLNPKNGIPVPGFTGDHNDNALLKVLRVLEKLEKAGDVRPILNKEYSSQLKSDYAKYF